MYFVKRFLALIVTLLAITMLTFLVFSVIPGNAALTSLGTDYTPEQEAALKKEMGLDQPIPVRYVRFLGGLFKGDLGKSYTYNQPVATLLSGKLKMTIFLAVETLVLIVLIAIPLGIFVARFADKVLGKGANLILQILLAIPPYFTGILIILVFGLTFGWFRPYQTVSLLESDRELIAVLFPAALSLAIPKIAVIVRFLRGAALDELGKDYVMTARSKGAGENRIFFGHILKNALIPVVTMLGMIAAEVMTGSIVIEQVFNLPGLGRFLIRSIGGRDYPVVQIIMMYMAFIVVIMNTIVDMLYRIIDPRISSAEE